MGRARRRRQMVEPEGRLTGTGRMVWGAPGFRPAPQCYRRRNGDVKSGPGGVMPLAHAGVNTDANANAGWDSDERRPRLLTGPLSALSPAGGG